MPFKAVVTRSLRAHALRSPARLVVALAAALALATSGVIATLAADPPNPSVSLSLPAQAMIGSTVTFTATFDNTSATKSGYGPYIDIRLPKGADNNDGLTFASATYAGSTLTATTLIANGGGCITHPYAVTAAGVPVQVCGLAAGQSYVVVRLPFGSFAPNQPPAAVTVTTTLSNLADLGTALSVTANGGFQFGATAINDPASDPSILGTTTTATVTPTVMTVTKAYAGPENETASGPNYPRTYTITVDVAPGQTITNLDVSDVLPTNLQFDAFNSSTPASTAQSTPSTSTPGGTLTRRFASVAGTNSASDATYTFTYHVPLTDAASARVINATTGSSVLSTDSASASGSWTPLDVRDAARTATAGPATHTLNDRSIAVQKSVAIASGGDLAPLGVVNPGDTLEWTLSLQVSDFFAFDNVVLDDRLGDGTRFDPSYTPRLTVAGNGFSSAAADFAPANVTVSAVEGGTGVTPISFRLAPELATRGLPSQLVGGCVDPAGGSGTPACAGYNDGATTATVTFRSVVQETYVDGTTRVVEGDTVANSAAVTGAVLNTGTLLPTGSIAGDGTAAVASAGSGASAVIPRSTLAKTVYAINGNTTVPSPIHASPGDTITFRLQVTFPTSRFYDFRLSDYLPLPVFGSTEVTGPFNTTADASVPAAGTAKYGPADTLHALAGAPTPSITTDATSNVVAFTYGDYQYPSPGTSSVADVLFTVTVTNSPFADGLFLTNQAQTLSKNSSGAQAAIDATLPMILDQPALAIAKGAVSATPGSGAVYAPATRGPRTFADPGTAACGSAWGGGAITGTGLGSTPVNSDVSNLDAGANVRFAVTVRNTGHEDAFDIAVRDTIPAGLVVPAGGLNLCVQRGDHSAVDVANVGGGSGLFDQGIKVTGSGNTAALIAGTSSLGVVNASGTDVLVISYDLEVAATARPALVATNTASLDAYSNAPGSSSHLSSPLTDTASATLRSISLAKSITGTDEPSTAGNSVAIGEIVSYRVVATIPEGATGPLTLTDTLPTGMAFVDCTSVSASTTDLSTGLAGGWADACNPPTNPTVTPASGATGGKTIVFSLGTVTNANRDDAAPETIAINYRVVVTNVAGNVRGTTRRNSAVAAWNDGATNRTSNTAQAPNVTVVEPLLTVAKDVAPLTGDAGDALTYTIVVANPVNANGEIAYEAALTDVIPAGLTYVPGSLTTSAGTAPTTLSIAGATISATWTTFPQGQTTTLQYQATADGSVQPAQSITNTAAATWTSLPGSVSGKSPYTGPSGGLTDTASERTGSTTDPGGAANTSRASDPATFTVSPLVPVKAMVATSEASTSGATVTIGEVIRYRMEVTIPEGSTPAMTIVDRLPNGLSYLPGSAVVALVSSGGGLTSDTITGASVAKVGNQTTLASITPDAVIPGGAVTGGVGDGSDVTFALGNLANAERDADLEFTVIEFGAVVDNVGTNTTGASLPNDFQVLSGAVVKDTSGTVPAVVAQPTLTVAKSVAIAPTDAGDPVRYSIVVTNAGNATAFDVDLRDTLDATLVPGAISASPSTGVTDLTSGSAIHFVIDSIAAGASVTVTVDATVAADTDTGKTIPNTASATWTSLPGAGTASNPTGWTTPGGSGSATGERDGSGGVNSYTASSSAPATLAAPSIAKLPITPATYAIGATPTFVLRVTVPEGTSRHLVVTDAIPAGLIVTGSTVTTTAASSGGDLASDFAGAGTLAAGAVIASPVGSAGGPYSIDFGDVSNPANNLAGDDAFLVTLSTRLANITGNQAGTTLTNRASLAYTDPESGPTAVNAPTARTITVVEPALTVAKTASTTAPGFGTTITYTIVVANPAGANTATAHDIALGDVIPAGLTYVPGSVISSAGTAPTTLGESGGVITATWTSLPVGATSTITYQAVVGGPGTVAIGQSLVNGVTLSWTSLAGSTPSERTGADGVGGALDDYAAAAKAPVTVSGVDLSLTKSDGTASTTAGSVLVYTLAATNGGTVTSTGIVLSETVPAHTTFRTSSSSAGWSCANGSPAGTTCTLAIGSLAAGGTATRTFAVAVDIPLPPGVASIGNTASVADDGNHGPDPQPGDNTATDTDAIPVADLSVTKSVDNPTPQVGGTVVFTVGIANAGPSAAPSVVLHDLLPAGLTFVSASASVGSYDAASGDWTVGTVAVGAAPVLSVHATVASAAAVTNVAEIASAGSSDPDSTPGNDAPSEDDRATATVTPQLADLAIAKTVDVARPNLGDTVTFTVTLTNHGPDAATHIVVTDALPAGLAFVSATPSTGGYDAGSGHWTVASLASGASATLTVTATVTAIGTLTNTATVTAADQHDPDPSNNSDSAQVAQLVDLVVAKSVDHPAQDVGGIVTFTVSVTNAGPNTATGVALHDALPAGLTYQSDDSGGAYNPSTGTWTVGSLADGAVATLHVSATVATPGAKTNTAAVSAVVEPQGSTANDHDSATVTPPQADLALAKSVSDPRVAVGEQTVWTITVTNNGPDTATGVAVADLLPVGLAYVSDTGSGSYSQATGVWTIGTLANGASASLDITSTVTIAGDRTNTAVVSATTYDPDGSNNADSAILTTKVADIVVTKDVDNTTPAVGASVVYTVTATDNGPDAARQVVVRDRLPAGLLYVSDDSGGAYDPATGDWAVGNLALDETKMLHITARVVGSGDIVNSAHLQSLVEQDNNPDNDVAAAGITAPDAADLSLTKTVDRQHVANGQQAVFTLTVSNAGPNAASGVAVTDQLPAGATYVADDSGGAYDPASGIWTVGSLPVDGSASLRITVTISTAGEVVNTAEITASSLPDPDSTPGNGGAGEDDQAQAVVNASTTADLSLTKQASTATATVGDHVIWTLTLHNAGPDAATGVLVRDTLSAKLIYVSHSGGAYNPKTGVWTVGTIAAGATRTLRIVTEVGRRGAINNVAEVVASDAFDPDSVPGNGASGEDDQAKAALGAVDPTQPPTWTTPPAAQTSDTGFGGLLLASVGLVAGLAVFIFGRPRRVTQRRR